MTLYYARFRCVHASVRKYENAPELMAFFDVPRTEDPIEHIKQHFRDVFKEEYGVYGRDYVLKDCGIVDADIGYPVENIECLDIDESMG